MTYKTLFDFIHKTLGYSPGGYNKGDICLFPSKNINEEGLNKLNDAMAKAALELDENEYSWLLKWKFATYEEGES